MDQSGERPHIKIGMQLGNPPKVDDTWVPMVSTGSRGTPKLRTSLLVVRVIPPKEKGVSQTTDVWDIHLKDIQPQSIHLHPLLNCCWKKGDVELSIISVLMTRNPYPLMTPPSGLI